MAATAPWEKSTRPGVIEREAVMLKYAPAASAASLVPMM